MRGEKMWGEKKKPTDKNSVGAREKKERKEKEREKRKKKVERVMGIEPT